MFPLAALLPLIELLRSTVLGVMRPLGDRTRRAPSMWTPVGKLIPEPLVVLIQAWLAKRRQLIEALIRRIAEGKHVGRAYKPRAITPDAIPRPRAEIPPEKRLPPRVIGWINRMASEVNPIAATLSHIVATPEMRAMIEASPQMARLWVPLLNALSQPRPEWWPKPPPRPRRPRRPRPRVRKIVAAAPDLAAAAPAPNPLAGIRSWAEYVNHMRPLSQTFAPPPVDDPVPLQLKPLWTGVALTSKGSRWEI